MEPGSNRTYLLLGISFLGLYRFAIDAEQNLISMESK